MSGSHAMSDSENQGAKVAPTGDELYASYKELPESGRKIMDKVIGLMWQHQIEKSALEAAVTTLKAQLEAAEGAAKWYADEARAIARALNGKKAEDIEPNRILASVTVLALDNGRRFYGTLSAPASDTGSEEGNDESA